MKSPARNKNNDAEAIAYFDAYLTKNVKAAETLRRMKPIIQEFSARAPSMCVWKCVDGRVHGSKAKGYPPGTITFARTDGANIDVSISNNALWDRINSVLADARKRTPGKPALFIAFAHRSDHPGFGCAAHGGDDEKALNAVMTHTQDIREAYRNAGYGNDLYTIAGITNTDDMSETLYFEDGSVIATADTIRDFDLKKPSDVFSTYFLNNAIDDTATDEFIDHKKPIELLDQKNTPLYRDLQTTLAMETYLLRAVTGIESKKGKGAGDIVNTSVYETLYAKLQSIKGLPPSLIGALLYQCLWNTAYALYQRNRIAGMSANEQRNQLDHAEELVCYGEGYETLPRNKCILVKPGRGNDIQSLEVAKKVLLHNRERVAQTHLPLVHINVEVSATIDSWQTFNDQVEARMMTRQRTIYEVFGDDVRVLSTYSYKDKKEFYPIRINPQDPRECYPVQVTEHMSARDFAKLSLDHREFSYTQSMLAKAPE